MDNEILKLIIPTLKYEKEISDYREEFVKYGGSMDGCMSLRTKENISEWIKQIDDASREETLPEGFVIATQFIYLRENDKKIVGVIQVRHYLNDYLEKFGGHIGYSICHSERRKGYATRMLNDVIPYCKEIGLKKILITCLKDNEGSRRTILNNGGVYENTVYDENSKRYLERYWIEIIK